MKLTLLPLLVYVMLLFASSSVTKDSLKNSVILGTTFSGLADYGSEFSGLALPGVHGSWGVLEHQKHSQERAYKCNALIKALRAS